MPIGPGRARAVQAAPIQGLLSGCSVPDDAVSFGQGVPFFGPPPEAVAAASEAAGEAKGQRYSEDAGWPSLRRLVAEKLRSENGIEADPDRGVLITFGGNHAFVTTLLAITEVGDEVVIPAPFYFNHVMAVRLAGCVPVLVGTGPDYVPDVAAVEAAMTPRTRAVVTVSPNNPTGAVYPEPVLRGINRLCGERGAYHISDEAYEHFVFDGAVHTSPASFPGAGGHTISLFSMSKSFGMSGYRIGYASFPEELHDDVIKVQDTVGICPPGPSQAAAEAALRVGSSYTRSFLAAMGRVRHLFAERLTGLPGVRFVPTQGGFYYLVGLEGVASSAEAARSLAETEGVVTVPGEAFGAPEPALRLSYGNISEEAASDGLDRLERGLRRLIG